jgi:hypothetical protein
MLLRRHPIVAAASRRINLRRINLLRINLAAMRGAKKAAGKRACVPAVFKSIEPDQTR